MMSDVRNLRGLLLVVPIGLAGCANPVAPKPPSLKLPQLAKNVRSERVGDEIVMRWTTPAGTTDKLKAKPPIDAVICRDDTASRDLAAAPEVKAPEVRTPGKDLASCVTVVSKVVVPGESEVSFALPPNLTAGPPQAIALRVELENNLGRSAGRSEATLIASGPAPGPVEGLQIAPTRSGALVRWQPHPDAAPVELQRLLISAPAAVKPQSSKLQTSKSQATPVPGAKPKQPAPPAPVVLRAPSSESASAPASDTGGMLDTSADRGAVYRYTAQRLLELNLAGQTLFIRGPVTQPVLFAMRDTFPPATPIGLAAIPGPGSADLSWEPNTDPDLAGYFVYRRSGDGTETKLTAEPVSSPAFRDTAATPAATFHYRVTAVDTSGNESKPSGEVVLTPP